MLIYANEYKNRIHNNYGTRVLINITYFKRLVADVYISTETFELKLSWLYEILKPIRSYVSDIYKCISIYK